MPTGRPSKYQEAYCNEVIETMAIESNLAALSPPRAEHKVGNLVVAHAEKAGETENLARREP